MEENIKSVVGNETTLCDECLYTPPCVICIPFDKENVRGNIPYTTNKFKEQGVASINRRIIQREHW